MTCYLERIWGQANGFANSVYNYNDHEFNGLNVPDVIIMEAGLFYFNLPKHTFGSRHKKLIFISEPW